MTKFSRKRKIGKLNTYDSLATKLASSWKEWLNVDVDSTLDFGEVSEEVFRTSGATTICTRALAQIPKEKRVEFMGDLYGIAEVIDLDDGSQIELFALPIQGLDWQVPEFVNDTLAFDEFTKGFHKAGFVDAGSSICLCSTPIDLMSAALILPHTLRKIAEAFLKSVTDHDTSAVSSVVQSYVTKPNDRGQLDITYVTQILLGARITPAQDSDVEVVNLFGYPNYSGEADADEHTAEKFAEDRQNAELKFYDIVEELMEKYDHRFTIETPNLWLDTLANAAFLRLNGSLDIQAAIVDREIGTECEGHIVIDNFNFTVAVKDKEHWYGPIDIPIGCIVFSDNSLRYWLEDTFEDRIVIYPDVETLYVNVDGIIT